MLAPSGYWQNIGSNQGLHGDLLAVDAIQQGHHIIPTNLTKASALYRPIDAFILH